MVGTGTFAEPTFEALLSTFGDNVVGLVTQPERDGGNKRGSTRQTGKGMANIAAARGFAIAQPASINSPEGLAALREMKPDLLVVAAYGQILSKDVLSVPTVGTINVHASLLPRYRGAAPVAYAILNGEKQTGVTIIKVTPGLDSGDMILQEAIDILPDDTTGELEARLAVLGAKLAVEAVRKYQSGEPVVGVKQDPALVTKAPKIKKEFGLIDWSKPAVEICNHVRAMQPWPTAYTFLHRPGKEPMRVIIIKCTGPGFHHRSKMPPPPGIIMRHDLSGLATPKSPADHWVHLHVQAAGTSFVRVISVQPAGKKPMTVRDFLGGHQFQYGWRFGPEVLS